MAQIIVFSTITTLYTFNVDKIIHHLYGNFSYYILLEKQIYIEREGTGVLVGFSMPGSHRLK
jgi:hypothetical protein